MQVKTCFESFRSLRKHSRSLTFALLYFYISIFSKSLHREAILEIKINHFNTKKSIYIAINKFNLAIKIWFIFKILREQNSLNHFELINNNQLQPSFSFQLGGRVFERYRLYVPLNRYCSQDQYHLQHKCIKSERRGGLLLTKYRILGIASFPY